MPAKNTIKTYIANGIYHIYNRGVEKRIIFTDNYDYRVFLNCLREAFLPPDQISKTPISFTLKGETFKGIQKSVKNFHNQIELLAYCLMPNHFHLLVSQENAHGIDAFMRSIATRYSIYFNKQHKRVGSLFQGPYKAIYVSDDAYLLHLSRYIHRNPLEHTKTLSNWHSSYAEYIGERQTSWVISQRILSYFHPEELPFLNTLNSYKQFVEYDSEDSNDAISEISLDDK